MCTLLDCFDIINDISLTGVRLHVAGGNSNDNRGSWIVWVVLGGVCLLALLAVLCFYLYHRRQEARRRKREEENAAALAWAEAYSQRHTVFVEQPDSRVDVAFTTEGAFTRDGLHQAA